MNRSIVRHGFVIILLALVGGLFIPQMAIPRLGLSAHTIGILSGALLIAIGAVWPLFTLSKSQRTIMYWAWLYSSYVNWLGCLIGALFGAGQVTPVASAGATGSAVVENVVGALLASVGIVSFVAVLLSIWGLRRHPGAAS